MVNCREALFTDPSTKMEDIIANTPIAPTIINEDSKFVVITYWWGCKRANKNTSRPCQEFYEKLLIKPFDMGELLDIHPDKITENFNWLRALATDNLAAFYNNKFAKYIRESGREDDAYEVKKELKRSILQIISNAVKANSHILRSMHSMMHIQAKYRKEYDRAEEAKEDLKEISAKIKKLADEYNKARAALKQSLRAYILELEKIMQYSDPLTYDGMIDNWIQKCVDANCNYMAIEYPEFTMPGGYQKAINAKPMFIQKALEACAPRAVVYIDGDMTINRYPHVFDMDDIDYMARGWSIDPRSSWKHAETGEIMVDPYVFETSGGIMYFSQSPESQALLNVWIHESDKEINKGKADDRIISMIFNTKQLLAPMKIIQLPIEYLWLSMDYDYTINEDNMNRDLIMVEHPECLTSEDTAASSGASSDRQPKFYSAIGEPYPRREKLYETVMFPSDLVASEFRPWLKYIGRVRYLPKYVKEKDLVNKHPFTVYPRGDFGERTEIYKENIARVQMEPDVYANNGSGLLILDEKTLTIPTILKQLNLGRDILYLPSEMGRFKRSGGLLANLKKIIADESRSRLEFIFADEERKANPSNMFNYKVDMKAPFYIRSTGNPILYMMFALLDDASKINTMLKDNYQFLSRIRCHVLKAEKHFGGSENDSELYSKDTEVATNLLYGTSQTGGGRRTRKSKPRRKTYTVNRRRRATTKKLKGRSRY